MLTATTSTAARITRPDWRAIILHVACDDGEAWSAPAAEIADANADDATFCATLRELAEGRIAEACWGGGAAPFFTVSRVAPDIAEAPTALGASFREASASVTRSLCASLRGIEAVSFQTLPPPPAQPPVAADLIEAGMAACSTGRAAYAYGFGLIVSHAKAAADRLAAGADPAEILAALLTTIERTDAAKDRALGVPTEARQ